MMLARRMNLLGRKVFLRLLHRDMGSVDISRSAIPPLALLQGLKSLRCLRAIDLRGCDHLSADHLIPALSRCPSLELLLVGDTPPSSRAFSRVLEDILAAHRPPPCPKEAADSWEEAAEALSQCQLPSRWCALRRIVWPDAPAYAADAVRSQAPRIELVREQLPPLDEPLVSRVDLRALERQNGAEARPGPPAPLIGSAP